MLLSISPAASGGMGWSLTGWQFNLLSAGALARGSRDALLARVKMRRCEGIEGRALLTKCGWSLRLQPGGRE